MKLTKICVFFAKVISKYGFSPDGEGVVQFTQTVKILEKQDPEVARLSQIVRQHLIPPTSGSMPSSGGDAGYACSSSNLSDVYSNHSTNQNRNQYYSPNHRNSANNYTNRQY